MGRKRRRRRRIRFRRSINYLMYRRGFTLQQVIAMRRAQKAPKSTITPSILEIIKEVGFPKVIPKPKPMIIIEKE
jgi:hypothetical protein